MTTGVTAAFTPLTLFAGTSASAFGQESDLAIDAAGDLLSIDPAGDVLAVTTGALTFAGALATIWGTAGALETDPRGGLLSVDPAGDVLAIQTGGTNVVADAARSLETEAWSGFQTEGGQTIETEGT